MHTVDLELLTFATVTASAIVFVGWLGLAGLVVFATQRWLGTLRARVGGKLPQPQHNVLAYIAYAACLGLWCMGPVLGAVLLPQPENAILGRNCLYCSLVNLTAITGLTCLGMAALGLFSPETLAPIFTLVPV